MLRSAPLRQNALGALSKRHIPLNYFDMPFHPLREQFQRQLTFPRKQTPHLSDRQAVLSALKVVVDVVVVGGGITKTQMSRWLLTALWNQPLRLFLLQTIDPTDCVVAEIMGCNLKRGCEHAHAHSRVHMPKHRRTLYCGILQRRLPRSLKACSEQRS